jgi:arylsulfatase
MPKKSKKPNILVIWGDDIGITNLSIYSQGLMGYRTPNIDRIGEEGVMFTDSYGEQSCTAGRSAFITGQSVYRTGLSKVGLPGANMGLSAEDPTIAQILRSLGYATGQFGKNHLGDRDEFLPTMHGFDEFFGNLYHLNAEEEPEQRDYPSEKDFPNFKKNFGPRGVLHCWAKPGGGQKIEDTGPLTRKRMETVDDEFLAAAKDFITRQHDDDKPFFVWFNSTHMHFRTHAKPESRGQAGRWQSEYHDVMIDHDRLVGELLQLLDDLQIADDTIVMYSTDNGPHRNSWPDAGTTPFRSEKNTNWEGAFRVPLLLRWPGKIQANSVSNGIVSHLDWLPTFVAAAATRLARRSSRCTSTATISVRTWVETRTRVRGPSCSISPTTEISWPSATTTGSSSSWSSGCAAPWRCGPSRSPSSGCRRSTTCAPIPSSSPTSPRTPTGTGW